MDIVVLIGIFLLGLAAGSFLNALVFRLGTAESILWGRSHCMKCKHTLEWSELIPVASFVALGGKCKACHSPISWQYPIVEILAAIIFVILYANYQSAIFWSSLFSVPDPSNLFWYALGLVYYLIASTLLLAIGIYDFRTRIIAPSLIWLFFVFAFGGLAARWFSGSTLVEISLTLMTAAAVFAFFAGLWFFSKGKAMGFGDAELASAMIVFLGAQQGLLALLFSFWLGALFGLALIVLGRARLKSEMPFGPFLVAGAFLALFWGKALLSAYFAIFL